MGWALFVSERPIQVVWSGADEIYTWDIDMYGDMHAHICSDCDQLALSLPLSLSYSFPSFTLWKFMLTLIQTSRHTRRTSLLSSS